ncbi:MAG: hypothetical protein L6W00_17235 [Lentisphaeria bacterium]|nr:MAG: hypothetical protein L6W00_17235 [Lentisphaeria bacterium]
MKTQFLALLFAAVLLHADAAPTPVFDWQKPGSAADSRFRQFLADGSIAKRPLPTVQDDQLKKQVILLDGNTLAAISFRHGGAPDGAGSGPLSGAAGRRDHLPPPYRGRATRLRDGVRLEKSV